MSRRLRRAKRIVLFLDFDGTLVGFKRNPEEVRLGGSERRLLERLSRHPRVSLVFISGRRRVDLKRRVAVRGAAYFGLHGFESRAGIRLSTASRRWLGRIRALVGKRIRGFRGVWLEDKRSSLALHYRNAPAGPAAKARAAVKQVLAAERAPLRVLQGKKILEMLPPEIEGKGAAASTLVRKLGRGVLPVYFGDDATDEMAFAALRKLARNGGPDPVTVHVGSGNQTEARYRVRTVGEVRIWLERVTEALS
ncbi:MAG: trehalose-phosphatase [Terriglobia bacterium]